MWARWAMAAALTAAASAEIIDRLVAVVGNEGVTASDVELEIRLEALFGDRSGGESRADVESALNRLIAQRLIAQDMALAGFLNVDEKDLDAAAAALREADFGGLSFEQALEKHAVSEPQAREFLRRQLRFSRYVDFRFRAGIEVSEEDLTRRYRAEYGRGPEAPPLEKVRDALRSRLLNEQVERALDARVREMKLTTRVVVLDPIGKVGGDF